MNAMNTYFTVAAQHGSKKAGKLEDFMWPAPHAANTPKQNMNNFALWVAGAAGISDGD